MFDKHEYNLILGDKRERVPSVTSIIPKQDYHCTPEQLDTARIEGSTNHELIKSYFDSGFTYGDEYLELFHEFMKSNSDLFGHVIQYENALISEKHKFGGTPDIICSKCIIDIKRSFGDPAIHALQLAGYHVLATEHKIIKPCKKWYIVWRDGNSFKMKNVWNNYAEGVFLSLIKIHYIQHGIDNYFKVLK